MMPKDFLIQISHQYELSKDQEEVFLLRYGEGLSYEVISDRLNTSQAACLKRMGQVYTKLNVSGVSRGKENRLRIFLAEQLQSQASAIPLASADTSKEKIKTLGDPGNIREAARPSEKSEAPQPMKQIYENLPNRDYTTFVGRHEELTRLLTLLSFDYAAHLISIDGLGGVGKTTLAIEAAHLCLQASRGDQPVYLGETLVPTFEAIVFVSAKEQYLQPRGLMQRLKRDRNLQDLYRAIAQTLERPEISYMEKGDQLDLIREALKRQRSLMIIDNLETLEQKEEVLSFAYDLPPNIKVILTTREQVLFVPIRLESLPADQGLELIRHQAREKGVTLESDTAQVLYQSTGGIPAAIVYTLGQIAAGYQIPDVLAKLKDAKGDIARFCFEGSVQRLREQPAHALLMALALFPDPADRTAIATIAATHDTADGLAHLQQLSLVRQQRDRYCFQPLTREYALAELGNHPQFEAGARSRWVAWYVEFSEKYGNVDEKEWYREYHYLDDEWCNLQDVMKWCKHQEDDQTVLALWRQIKGYAQVRGYWGDRLDWTAWLCPFAERRQDWATVAELFADEGWTKVLTRQPQFLEQASQLLRSAWALRLEKDVLFQLELATRIAVLYIQCHDYDQAGTWLKSQQKILKQSEGLSVRERQQQEVLTLYYQAQICFQQEDYSKAKKLYQRSLTQAQAIQWQRIQVGIKNWLAEIEIKLGDLENAQQLLELGLSLATENKDKHSLTFHQRSLARLWRSRGDPTQAQNWAAQAAEGFESLKMMTDAIEMRAWVGDTS
jgi:tetratricopeptide (TPR) repeat protein